MPGWRHRLACWALLLACWLPALAHQGGVTGYAVITVDGERVAYDLTLSELPPALAGKVQASAAGPDLSPLAEALAGAITVTADGAPCRAATVQAQPSGDGRPGVRLQVGYRCPHAAAVLGVTDGFIDLAGGALHTLAKVRWPGGEAAHSFADENRKATFAVTAAAVDGKPASTADGSFFRLGLQHILEGYDHLLFLAALLIRARGWGTVFKVITAFTVAHSLTLALAVLGVVNPPVRLVEAGIALSIAYVALDNLFGRSSTAQRWGISFLFGLVHGLGFSTILREMDLGRERLGWLLLQFNLGVEFGQALVALVALGLLRWLRPHAWSAAALRLASCAILVAGVVLFVDRALVF